METIGTMATYDDALQAQGPHSIRDAYFVPDI